MSLFENVRVWNGLGFLACAGLMGFALYAQHFLGLEPCPLCIFQRMAVIVLGLIFLMAAVHSAGRPGRRIYAALLGVVSLAGIGVAIRQLWLQSLPPDRIPACGPGLDFMLESLPIFEMLKTVLSGSGECAKVDWRLLGLSMPGWVVIALVVLGGAGVLLNWRSAGRRAP